MNEIIPLIGVTESSINRNNTQNNPVVLDSGSSLSSEDYIQTDVRKYDIA